MSDERIQLSNLIHALEQPNPWERIAGFDQHLVAVARGQGVPITLDHPILGWVRPSFRDAWLEVVRATDRMCRGDWAWKPAAAPAAPASAAPTPASTGKTLARLLKERE